VTAWQAASAERLDAGVADMPSIGTLPPGARALVLTISDGVAAGTRHDESGIALADRLALAGFRVDRISVADDRSAIEQALKDAAAEHALVVSTGGTGLTPRDVTPQATQAVIDYEVPGLAEAMRAAGRAATPMADLSRGVVGVIGRSLVVNVPGSPKAALESLAAIEATLGHALETLAGPFDHGAPADAPAHLDAPTPARPSTPLREGEDTSAEWLPRPDDNDEWRDLPERGSR
jgi:molybdenum cofactor synthesis domain-containing protein